MPCGVVEVEVEGSTALVCSSCFPFPDSCADSSDDLESIVKDSRDVWPPLYYRICTRVIADYAHTYRYSRTTWVDFGCDVTQVKASR